MSDDGFASHFEAAWEEHVNFGTSRAHKRLDKKKAAAQDGERSAVSAAAAQKAPRKRAAASSADDHGARPKGSHQSQQRRPSAPAATLANTGRFSGTLAAKLLLGGNAEARLPER